MGVWLAAKSHALSHTLTGCYAGLISVKSVGDDRSPLVLSDAPTQDGKEPKKIQNVAGLPEAICLCAWLFKAFWYLTGILTYYWPLQDAHEMDREETAMYM